SIHQPAYQKVYIAPSCHQNKTDCLALQVLEDILNGGPTTRLYKSLVVDQKKASSVDFSYNGDALDNGTIAVSGAPAPGVAPQELEPLTEAEIAAVIEKGVTEAEVKEAIQ